MNVFKRLYNAITFEMAITLSIVFATLTAFLIILSLRTQNEAIEQMENNLLEKCQKACYPNTVYSTMYNHCLCNASVVVKEIQ